METIDHHIQRNIIARLMNSENLRFSELKPQGMESNIFMYHLKKLIAIDYVEKKDSFYTLAPKGLGYVDNLSTLNLKIRSQPKIVAMFVIQNKAGHILMSKRLTQPFINHYTLPCGKQHIGETINEHAMREKRDKLGFEIEVQYRGQFESLIEQDDTPIFHSLNHIFSAQIENNDSIMSPDKRFELVWVKDSDLSGTLLVPSTDLIVRRTLSKAGDKMFVDSVRTSL